MREGQPNVILEAMAAGLPVCATETGGIPRLVTRGESGLLSPVGDSAAFADNCAALLADPAQGDRFGRAGRQRGERRFSLPMLRPVRSPALELCRRTCGKYRDL